MKREEKILTIEKIRFVDKWVEFWFKEEHETMSGDKDGYHLSSKSYMLWSAVEKADIENEIHNNGFRGKKIKWFKDEGGCNWEIDCFILETT